MHSRRVPGHSRSLSETVSYLLTVDGGRSRAAPGVHSAGPHSTHVTTQTKTRLSLGFLPPRLPVPPNLQTQTKLVDLRAFGLFLPFSRVIQYLSEVLRAVLGSDFMFGGAKQLGSPINLVAADLLSEDLLAAQATCHSRPASQQQAERARLADEVTREPWRLRPASPPAVRPRPSRSPARTPPVRSSSRAAHGSPPPSATSRSDSCSCSGSGGVGSGRSPGKLNLSSSGLGRGSMCTRGSEGSGGRPSEPSESPAVGSGRAEGRDALEYLVGRRIERQRQRPRPHHTPGDGERARPGSGPSPRPAGPGPR